MDTERLAAARTQFEDDGFYLHQEPLVPDDLIRRATEGMDAVRSGDYDTGEPPRGGWQPGRSLGGAWEHREEGTDNGQPRINALGGGGSWQPGRSPGGQGGGPATEKQPFC